jgi:hypothetical protein
MSLELDDFSGRQWFRIRLSETLLGAKLYGRGVKEVVMFQELAANGLGYIT